jgi:hypothetical protein
MSKNRYALTPGYTQQLALGLDLDPVDRSEVGYVSPEEARLRSEAARAALALTDTAEAPAWWEQYQALLDAGWPWRVACYIAWASSPRQARWPKTQDELARQVLGLTSDRQIATWRAKNPAIDELIASLQALPLMDHRADVFRALAVSASTHDHRNNPDRKLFLELTGDYSPRSEVTVNRGIGDAADLGELSEAELDAIIHAAKSVTPGPADEAEGDAA